LDIKKLIGNFLESKFSGDSSAIKVSFVNKGEISKVLIHVNVFAKILAYNIAFHAKFKQLENAGILTGLRLGEIILITGAYQAQKLITSNVEFTIPEDELIRIDQQRINDHQPGFVGLYHLHPGFGSFLSDVDIKTTERFSRFYGKSVNIVLSLKNENIEFGFFTVQDGKPKKLSYEFLVGPSDV